MKLLSKNRISSDFNVQRKQQIDEGVAIAKRVDVLRETLQSLEAQHKRFIAGSRQELENATGTLILQKADLEGEIRKLEERRTKALKPIDEEWEKLNESKAIYNSEVQTLSLKKEELYERESKITKIESDNENTRQKLLELKEFAERKAGEAITDAGNAKKSRKEAETDRNSQTRDFAERDRELTKTDQELANQTKYLEMVKENLNLREKELNDRERFINDKYATLLRTQERMKQ